jgi:hypothetical protein
MNKQVVTISRQWDNPSILTTIDQNEISLKISLEDFITALKHEIGTVAYTFTRASLNEKIDNAVNLVLESIKEESSKVV